MSRAIGSKSTQEQSVFMIHLESVSLSVRLVRSTIPELWGLYAVCSFHLMFKVLFSCCTKSAVKAGPLSRPMLVGKSKSGNYFPKQAPGYFRCSFSPGRKSFYPFRERTSRYIPGGNAVASVRFHFSEVHFQGVQRAACLSAESLEVFVCAERQH